MKKTYYIYYTAKNNCAHKTIVKNKTLGYTLIYINQVLNPLEYTIFDRDTWNTSEPEGLIAFSANPHNYFYNMTHKSTCK